MLDNPVIKWGTPLFVLFFIYTATSDASTVGTDFGGAAVDMLDRLLEFVSALLNGASS